MRISDWSSDVCSSDRGEARQPRADEAPEAAGERSGAEGPPVAGAPRAAGEDLGGMGEAVEAIGDEGLELQQDGIAGQHDIAEAGAFGGEDAEGEHQAKRSEEHTSELQSLMRNSYAVFC